ncbi:TPA: hypothetical protein JGU28_004520 [Salmonella enterica]|nr:hypothetical protein [Salmonella enterica]
MAFSCKISEIITYLQGHEHDDFVLCSLWYEDDIRSVDDSVTPEEARAALSHAAEHFDADHGITWDTLEDALDHIRSETHQPD